jgi:hypothetical protein
LGEALFDHVSFSLPGTYTLTASDGTLTSTTSPPVVITPASGYYTYYNLSGNTFDIRSLNDIDGVRVTAQQLRRGKPVGHAQSQLSAYGSFQGIDGGSDEIFPNFEFTLAPGTYEVTATLPRHYAASLPGSLTYVVSLEPNEQIQTIEFGFKRVPKAAAGSAAVAPMLAAAPTDDAEAAPLKPDDADADVLQ